MASLISVNLWLFHSISSPGALHFFSPKVSFPNPRGSRNKHIRERFSLHNRLLQLQVYPSGILGMALELLMLKYARTRRSRGADGLRWNALWDTQLPQFTSDAHLVKWVKHLHTQPIKPCFQVCELGIGKVFGRDCWCVERSWRCGCKVYSSL